jgi:hypothetical protein
MSRNSDMMEDGTVWIGLFAHNVTDYSSPLGGRNSEFRMAGNSGTVMLSSIDMPALNTEYKAVMTTSYDRILGVSNLFYICPTSLATDKLQYNQGELMNVTYNMRKTSDGTENNFAWIGLFACNASDYSTPIGWLQDAAYGLSGNSGSIMLSSRYMPVLNSKYKAVMAVRDSQPLRILGVSGCFESVPNPAALATDKLQYNEANSVTIEVCRVCALAFMLLMHVFVVKTKKK